MDSYGNIINPIVGVYLYIPKDFLLKVKGGMSGSSPNTREFRRLQQVEKCDERYKVYSMMQGSLNEMQLLRASKSYANVCPKTPS